MNVSLSLSLSPGSRPVDFLTMTQESDPVRRLSTVSSVTKPAHYILTTEWVWYYKGDHENWIEFGRPVSLEGEGEALSFVVVVLWLRCG